MITDQLACPACDAHLKLRKALEAGKRIRCPKCGEIFTPGGQSTFGAAAPEAVNQTIAWHEGSTHNHPPAHATQEPTKKRRRRRVRQQGLPWVTIGLAAFLLLVIGGAVVMAVVQLSDNDAYLQAHVKDPPVNLNKPAPQVPAQKPAWVAPPVGLFDNYLAPDIDAADVNGHRFKLSDYRGKVVFLDFWGDWCPFCNKLYPYKREVMKKFGIRPFTVLGVDCERHSDKDQARRVMQREQVNWPTWWSPLSTGQVHRSWQINAFPNVTILDHRGVIRRRGVFSDPASWPALTQFLEQLLAECERDRAAGGPLASGK